MIKLNKLYTKDRQDFISFVNSKGVEVSIPIDRWHLDRIKLYLDSISEGSAPFEIQESTQEEELDNNS